MLARIVLAIGALSFVMGCGPTVGEAIRPKETTAKEALGATSNLEACEPDYAKPLIIDISPEDRGDLEAKLKLGGPVVNFDCKSMKIMPTCRYKGLAYKYVGYTPKAQLVEMENGDDLGAALPINGMKFKAGLERTGRLNLATMTIGQRTAGLLQVPADRLEGSCDNATHVVNSVWIGAFKLATGTKGEVMAAAEVFGAEAHAGSKSERKAMTSDGDVQSCEKAKEDADAPPSGCTAFVRLELLKIDRTPVVAAPPASAPAEEKPVSCSPGRNWNGNACVSPTASKVCISSEKESCKLRCDTGDGAACHALAQTINKQNDYGEAAKLYERACDLGVAEACSRRASIGRYVKGADVAQEKANRVTWFSRGCSGGHMWSCHDAAKEYLAAKEFPRAAAMFRRGCTLGNPRSCAGLADRLIAGEGVPKDQAAGLKLFDEICTTTLAEACGDLVSYYESGDAGVAKDAAKAEKYRLLACTSASGSGAACFKLGEQFESKKDKAKADQYFGLACDKKDTRGCKKVGR